MESWLLLRELEDVGLENIAQYIPNDDETWNKQSFTQLAEELEPMQELGHHFVGAEIMMFRGDQMARGHAVVRS